jgi:hypothetical protein
MLGPFNEGLHSFQFSEDGSLLLLCCGDGSCHIFCARTAVLFMSIRCPTGVKHLSSLGSPLVSAHASFSPDCSQVVFLPGGSCSVYVHSLHSSRLQTSNTVNQKSVLFSSHIHGCVTLIVLFADVNSQARVGHRRQKEVSHSQRFPLCSEFDSRNIVAQAYVSLH